MVTRVEGEFSKSSVEVTRARTLVPTETGVHYLVIEDDGNRGKVWQQMALGGVILPVPLARFREVVEVNPKKPEGEVWTGHEYRRVSFR